MKNSNDTIGNRTRDLPTCSTAPQPTAPPRAPGPAIQYYIARIPLYLDPSYSFYDIFQIGFLSAFSHLAHFKPRHLIKDIVMQPVLPVDRAFTGNTDMERNCRFIHFALCIMWSFMCFI